MGGVTKIRARQTRAEEAYDISGGNLATDKEVETRVRKHSALFHHYRDDNTHFHFDVDGNLNKIVISDDSDTDKYQQSDFTFDSDGNLSSIIKEIWDPEGNQYVKMQKDFLFVDGNLTEIQNRII
jgi:septation ring formation regulator EzrA